MNSVLFVLHGNVFTMTLPTLKRKTCHGSANMLGAWNSLSNARNGQTPNCLVRNNRPLPILPGTGWEIVTRAISTGQAKPFVHVAKCMV